MLSFNSPRRPLSGSLEAKRHTLRHATNKGAVKLGFGLAECQPRGEPPAASHLHAKTARDAHRKAASASDRRKRILGGLHLPPP